eukprot:SAG31_NODE_123_length_23712_cov_41.426291_34_plen_88_part_00
MLIYVDETLSSLAHSPVRNGHIDCNGMCGTIRSCAHPLQWGDDCSYHINSVSDEINNLNVRSYDLRCFQSQQIEMINFELHEVRMLI